MSDSESSDPSPHSLILVQTIFEGRIGTQAHYVRHDKISDEERNMLFELVSNQREYRERRKISLAKVCVWLSLESDCYTFRHPELKGEEKRWISPCLSKQALDHEELTDSLDAPQCEFLTQGVYVIQNDYFDEEQAEANSEAKKRKL